MAGRRAARTPLPRERWAAQIAALDSRSPDDTAGRAPLTVERIVAAALGVVAAEGFDALTMRRVSTALETGPASLYAHVRNKSELDDLLVAALCARLTLPTPDQAQWKSQFRDVCAALRDEFLRYPGLARAALAAVPGSVEVLRVGECLLGILLAGGVAPKTAAWTTDAAFLYVSAYCLEAGMARRPGEDADARVVDRAEVRERLAMLPPHLFPHTTAHAQELTAGEEHERFDFTLGLMLRGLA